MARLLACNPCGILWRMKDYDGDPQYDMELREIIDRHLATAVDPRPDSHLANLFRVTDKEASMLDVESALQKELKDINVFIRETRDDMKLDAVKCFNAHNRPMGGCPDWENDSKVIGRKIGVPRSEWQYLCHFCPAAQHVVFKARQAKGLYGKG